MKVYLVGGYVRDKLLGLDPKDLDYVVVNGEPSYFIKKGFKQVGADFPVFLHPETGDEYALARKERKVGDGYHGFECQFDKSVSLKDDLFRRDLTINSLAMSKEGKIIDYFNGEQDLKNKTLRHVSDHFKEDPLRVLRVARFLARYHKFGFTIHKDTKELMKDIVNSGEIHNLNNERIKLETDKALLEDNPDKYFEALRECGALKIIFPEIDCLFGIPQPEQHHPEIDTGIHTLLVLMEAKKISQKYENKNEKLILLWSALLHDLGKGVTPEDQLPRHINHEKNGVPIIEKFADRLKLTSKEKQIAKMTSLLHLSVHTSLDFKKEKDLLELFKKMDAFRNPKNLFIILDACEADARGRTGLENRDYPQKKYLKILFNNLKLVDQKSISQRVMGNNNISKTQKGFAIKQGVEDAMIHNIRGTKRFEKNKDGYIDFFNKLEKGEIAKFQSNNINMLNDFISNLNIREFILENKKVKQKSIKKIEDFVNKISEIKFENLTQEQKDTLKYNEISQTLEYKKNIIIDTFLQSFSTKSYKRKP